MPFFVRLHVTVLNMTYISHFLMLKGTLMYNLKKYAVCSLDMSIPLLRDTSVLFVDNIIVTNYTPSCSNMSYLSHDI